MSRIQMALAVVLCAGAAFGLVVAQEPDAVPRPEVQDLISVRVAGTTIDFVPDYVDVVTASPEEQAAKLVAAGGRSDIGDVPTIVTFRHIRYILETPDEWTKATGHQFHDGDVVYTYKVESPEDRDEFVRGYALTKVADLAGETRSHPLYRASPGYYVLVPVPVTTFTCAMHPQIRTAEKGKCPICGMGLIPMETRW